MTAIDSMKKTAALSAIDFIKSGMIIGVGTGSTVNFFIEALNSVKHKIDGVIASSTATAAKLKALHIPLLDLNEVGSVPLYIDGADEFNDFLSLIKGGGGALTREKILAAASDQFVCIADQNKKVKALGRFPVPVEVIPMARSFVAREIIKLGGEPVYRQGFVTDNGNIILDIHHLPLLQPIALEEKINNIVGVVANGIFAKRGADLILMGTLSGKVETIYSRFHIDS